MGNSIHPKGAQGWFANFSPCKYSMLRNISSFSDAPFLAGWKSG